MEIEEIQIHALGMNRIDAKGNYNHRWMTEET